MRDLTSIVPLSLDDHRNVVHEPYPVPEVTYGWAAGDAAYALGGFELDGDQALVIEGRAPACAFWNVCLWNPFLAGFDYRYERVTLNGAQAQVAADGTYRLVVAATDPGLPNWLSTAGHRSGVVWFRWFLPDETPDPLSPRVLPLAELTSALTDPTRRPRSRRSGPSGCRDRLAATSPHAHADRRRRTTARRWR